jgi:hypothetical protein
MTRVFLPFHEWGNNPGWASGKHLSCASQAEGSPGGKILWKIQGRRFEGKRDAITLVIN